MAYVIPKINYLLDCIDLSLTWAGLFKAWLSLPRYIYKFYLPYPALIGLIMWHINHKRLCITTFSDTQTVFFFLQQYTTYNTTLTILAYNLRYLRCSTLLFIYIYTYIHISVQHKKGAGGDIEQIFKKRASNSKKTKKNQLTRIFPADSLKS